MRRPFNREEAIKQLSVLELVPGAIKSDAKNAHRTLLKVWHPDRFQKDEKLRAISAEKSKLINQAYTWLCDHPEIFSNPEILADRSAQNLNISESANVKNQNEQPSYASRHQSTVSHHAASPLAREKNSNGFKFVVFIFFLVGVVGLLSRAKNSTKSHAQAVPQYNRVKNTGPNDPLPQIKPGFQNYDFSPKQSNKKDYFDNIKSEERTFRIGSSKAEVKRLMGTPTRIFQYTGIGQEDWYYGYSQIQFRSGKVSGWQNQGNLLVWQGDNALTADPITIGSTKIQVIDAMGTPTRLFHYYGLNEEDWYYGFSKIVLRSGKVAGWDNNGNLKVWLGNQPYNAADITIGSTKAQVINAMGTPTRIFRYLGIDQEDWHYGISKVAFKAGKVKGWDNAGNLRVHLE